LIAWGGYGGSITYAVVNDIELGHIYGGNQASHSISLTHRVYKDDVYSLRWFQSEAQSNVHLYYPVISF